MKEKKYLPIGSVVLLKGGIKKTMITGYMYAKSKESKEIYDYTGCTYPEGIIAYNRFGLFNHDQIQEIVYMGLENDEEKMFNEFLNSVNKKENEN